MPDGLIIIDCGEEMKNTMVITAQKFAKGTRFGKFIYFFSPLLLFYITLHYIHTSSVLDKMKKNF